MRKSLSKTIFNLFMTFFKIGAFTFGGGWVMIAMMEKDIVDKHKWFTKEEFIDNLAIAQSMPGILAVNMAVLVGNKMAKKRGAFFSALGTILPSFIVILTIAIFFVTINDNPVVERVFKGIRPAVVALIIAPVFTTAKAAKINIKNFWVPVATAFLITFCGFSPIMFIALAIVYGVARCYFNNKQSKTE